jgi:hypothetical protein
MMSYIDEQFKKVFADLDHVIQLKIVGKGGSTNWLSITEHEAEYIHRLLKSNNYDERTSAQ